LLEPFLPELPVAALDLARRLPSLSLKALFQAPQLVTPILQHLLAAARLPTILLKHLGPLQLVFVVFFCVGLQTLERALHRPLGFGQRPLRLLALLLGILPTQPLANLLLRLPFEPLAFYPAFLIDPLGMSVLGLGRATSNHVPLIAFTLGALTFVGLLGGAALLLLPLRLLVVDALLDDPHLVIRL